MNLFAIWFALCIHQNFLPFFMLLQCVSVCVRATAGKQWQTHILTSFIRISCFSPILCRKPPFPGVNFFHYKGNWKEDGGYFFCAFLPWWVHAFQEELCHPGISTPCRHPLCSSRQPLHHLSLRERERERVVERKDKKKQQRVKK